MTKSIAYYKKPAQTVRVNWSWTIADDEMIFFPYQSNWIIILYFRSIILTRNAFLNKYNIRNIDLKYQIR